MNIDEMQAGRELDQFIAERVLEWSEHYFGRTRLWKGANGSLNGWSLDEWPELTQVEIEDGYTRCEFVDMWMPHGIFRPSVDIAAAWVVLERIYEIKGNWICVEKSIDGDFNAGVVGDISDPGWWRWATNAPTAQLAICRVALKAVTE